MKKVLVFLFCISMMLVFSTTDEEKIIVPNSAIRYRIIANSNDFKDQELKYKINTDIEPILLNILSNSPTIDDSRKNINKSLSEIEKVINKYDVKYNVNYGMNYFPEKNYKGVTYEEGNYESLVITLGEGLGENWWCVLFPPLCLLEASESDIDDVEYSLYIKNVIDRFY